jgi:dihydropteroate synthase-like protein
MTAEILKSKPPSKYNLILLPGFVQWDTSNLEQRFSVDIRKGPEFASDLPVVLKNIERITLSNKIPANQLIESSGEALYNQIKQEQYDLAKEKLSPSTFFINEEKSDIIIGSSLPPPIIAEIVNCPDKSDKSIIRKAEYYIDSGADVIDIGCVSNKPNPDRVGEIIKLLRENFNVLISIDSMDASEILAAVDEDVDLILSLDVGNYKACLNIPKEIPIVILPTNIKEGYFPKDPKSRVDNLLNFTKVMHDLGFKKLIADPLLETPISPGISNSLEAFFLYNKSTSKLPLFFGISNVVELMDVDSIGINGLLASIAIELGVGILFTVEHSTKLMGGVRELKECVKLNYVANHKKTPPINQGISVFRAKEKISQDMPTINENDAVIVDQLNLDYIPDKRGYFKFYLDHYSAKIYVLFFSNEHKLQETIIGKNAEALSKKIVELNITNDISHLNYLGRELAKAENCLYLGKPYIQDV